MEGRCEDVRWQVSMLLTFLTIDESQIQWQELQEEDGVTREERDALCLYLLLHMDIPDELAHTVQEVLAEHPLIRDRVSKPASPTILPLLLVELLDAASSEHTDALESLGVHAQQREALAGFVANQLTCLRPWHCIMKD